MKKFTIFTVLAVSLILATAFQALAICETPHFTAQGISKTPSTECRLYDDSTAESAAIQNANEKCGEGEWATTASEFSFAHACEDTKLAVSTATAEFKCCFEW